ncbi:MAG TPA: hypothetical protein VFV99_26755 [Kofleriaceae bacterium]|nr:hypothetical protein [Kofleriaceae bacterium]
MKLANLLPLLLLAACTDNATKQESVQIFAGATTAMTSAQSRAVDQARGNHLNAPADLTLDYSGPCTLGGTVALSGDYTGDSAVDDRAAFDLKATFNGCHELTGTLDGDLQWTSVATGDSFTATMTGGLNWKGNDGEASCDFDLSLSVGTTGVSYDGHLCGYDVKTEIVLGH